VPNGCPIPFSRSKMVSPYYIMDIEFPETITSISYGL
jgi:hypothetical protein